MAATRTSPATVERRAGAFAIAVVDPDHWRGRRLAAALEAAFDRPVERVPTCASIAGTDDEPAVVVLRMDGTRPADVVPVPAPHVRVLALAPDAAGARAALAAGAHSAAIDGDEEALVAVVAAVAAGYAVSPESLRGRLSHGLLTTREKQVLAMVVMGFSNREIGTTLHITETTVKSHLSSAFRKLHVRSRHEATALILDPESGAGTGILAIS